MRLYDCDAAKEPRLPKKKIKHFPKKAKAHRVRIKGNIRENGTFTVTHESSLSSPCGKIKDVYNVPTGNLSQRIEDTSGLIQNWWNPCFHEVYSGQLNIQPISVTNGDVSGTMSFSEGFCIRDALRASIPRPDENTLDDLAAMSENHFVNATGNGQESLANFLIELYQACQGNIRALKKYGAKYKRAIDRFKEAYDRFLKRGYGQAASWWLAWNFAIKPIIGDLKRLACAYYRAVKRFKWLQARNHLPTKVQFRVKDCFDAPDIVVLENLLPKLTLWADQGQICSDVTIPPINVPIEFDCWIELRKLTYELDYSATGWVRWDLPSWLFDNPGAGVSYLTAQQEGFTNPVKIIWNAIPYTWLIDWFVSYRTHLQENSADLGPYSDGTLLNSGHSFRLRSVWEVIVCVQPVNSGVAEYSIGQVVYNTYTRVIGLPQAVANPFRVPWEGYNFSIITALLWQRRERRR